MKAKLVKEGLNEEGTYGNISMALAAVFDGLETIIDKVDEGKLKPDIDEFGEGWRDVLADARHIIGRLLNYQYNIYDTK